MYVPDDFHHHLRDGDVLSDVVNFASEAFDYVLVMPNINPPVRKVKDADEYLQRILDSQTENYIDVNRSSFPTLKLRRRVSWRISTTCSILVRCRTCSRMMRCPRSWGPTR